MFFFIRCDPEQLTDCFIKQRASNLAVVKLDFNREAFVQKNIVDRAPFNTRIAGFGGTIGKQKICVDKIFQIYYYNIFSY